MYDELIKNLRHDSLSALQNCEFDFVHDWMLKAADAIEELQKQLDNSEIENIKLKEEFAKYRGENVTTNYMRCYFCGAPLRWEVDFSFRDYGVEETEGVVGNYTCDGCGASYEIWKPFEKK